MRIALIADVHGNAVALDAALNDITQQAVDRIVCLGDLAMLGPQPHTCIERIHALDCPVIMGNGDEWMASDEAAGLTPDGSAPKEVIAYWGVQQLSDADRAYLSALPYTHKAALDEAHALLCFHGSPRNCREVILASTPEPDVLRMFGEQRAAAFAGAHTHVQMLRHVAQRVFINPGSIGMPRDADPVPDVSPDYAPRADYAILDWQHGYLNVTFRRVPYALNALRESVQHSGMPHADWWLGQWRA